jgi:MFS family permease
MLYFMAPTLTVAFLPLYAAQELGLSTVSVGILIASIYAVELLSMPIIGYLGDRFGRKRTIIAGLLASFVLFLLYFMVRSSTQLFLVSMGTGVAFSGTSLLLSMIPDVTPKRMYGATVGVFGSFEDLGSIAGPLLFGLVWSTLGPIYIFAVTAVTQLAAAGLVVGIADSRVGSG